MHPNERQVCQYNSKRTNMVSPDSKLSRDQAELRDRFWRLQRDIDTINPSGSLLLCHFSIFIRVHLIIRTETHRNLINAKSGIAQVYMQ